MIKIEDLSMRNYVLVIDRSGSMGEPISKTNKSSRWDTVKESAIAVARACEKYDADGIDVYTFNKSFQKFANTTAAKVSEIFSSVQPMGGTDFVPVLTDVFNTHFKGDKPTTVLVITDGEPSEGVSGQRALAKLIIDTTNKMEGDAELGVEFIQIGNDPAASTFLKKLDDELQSNGAKFDIVDVKTCDEMESMTIEEVLLAAVND